MWLRTRFISLFTSVPQKNCLLRTAPSMPFEVMPPLNTFPEPEKALKEMRRVLKNQGFLLLAPAWQCRPWAAMGHSVRPYRDFDFKGKIIKLSIPLRNSMLFRSMYVFPRRLFRTIQFFFRKSPIHFKYRKLKPNYDYFGYQILTHLILQTPTMQFYGLYPAAIPAFHVAGGSLNSSSEQAL